MKKIICGLLLAAATLPAQNAKPPVHKHATKPLEFPFKSSAFDKAVMEAYVRHLFVWPPPIEIEVLNPRPSELAGFSEVVVRAKQGAVSQDEKFYVSKDGQQIIRGTIFQVGDNPFKDQLKKLNTDLRPSLGTPGAPVVLVEFSDFQCPHCREEAKVLRQNLLTDYPKEVRLYFMDFPLESIHPWAKAAAIAGRCIAHQNPEAFWTYHDWIFEHQEETTAENLKGRVLEWGKSKDFDGIQLSTCLDSRATEKEIDDSLRIGKSIDVASTPTIFVNGRPLSGNVPWLDLKRILDFEIGYQLTAKNAGENCGCDVKLTTPGVK